MVCLQRSGSQITGIMSTKRVELAHSLIAVLEGERLEAYQDSGGVWTIGMGHTGSDVHPGMKITSERSAELLAQDAVHLFRQVQDLPDVAAAAWVSFGYNAGALRLHNALAGLLDMRTIIHDAHGNVQPGLVRRRALEWALINS